MAKAKTKAKKVPAQRARRAQLIAEVVAVICPWCSDPQPNPDDGSEQWSIEHFRNDETDAHGRRGRSHTRHCSSCDGPMLIDAEPKVMFQ